MYYESFEPSPRNRDAQDSLNRVYAFTFTLVLAVLLRCCAAKRSTVAWPAFLARQS